MRILILSFLLMMGSASAKETKNLADHMNSMLSHLIQLGSYFDNSERLYDSANREKILNHAKGLKSEFEKASHTKILASDSLAPSVELLTEDLNTMIEAVEDKNMNYARMQFGAMRSICLSCHTQVNWRPSAQVMETMATMSGDASLSLVDKGDIYSVIRDYAKSSQYYQSALQDSAKVLSQTEEMRILRKILHNFLTGMVDVRAARDFFAANFGSFKLSKGARENVQAWLDELNVWLKGLDQAGKVSLSKFLAFYKDRDQSVGEGYYGAREVISYLLLGRAGKGLVDDESGHSRAELLYYLGEADEIVDDNILFNLSDLYFKKCVSEYPTSPFARKCYQRYEESVYRGFSGSGGVFIPNEVRKELKDLKAMLK